jgi:hypothetical protein
VSDQPSTKQADNDNDDDDFPGSHDTSYAFGAYSRLEPGWMRGLTRPLPVFMP